jgi:hypothetical protein
VLLLEGTTRTRGCPPLFAQEWGPDRCVFGSKMVLASSDVWQAGSTPARIWGRHAAPHELITLRGLPAGTTVLPSNPWLADTHGNWSITVAVQASPTAYNLTFTGAAADAGDGGRDGARNVAVLKNVLFGHTLLCGGQSNMDMCVGCTFGSLLSNRNAEQAKAFPDIRYMENGASGRWESAADIDVHGSPAVLNFSATCYFTALNLKLHVPAFGRVPIGLVRSSIAAQTIERFLSPSVLEAAGVPKENATSVGCSDQTAHTLYDELIVPLAPFVFKALVWYQGEANVACNWDGSPSAPLWQHNYYHTLLSALISSWRALFDVTFSVVVVQLAAYKNSVGNGSALPELRAAQQLGASAQPHTGLAYPIDIGDDIRDVYPNPGRCHEFGGIHPRNKTEVGRRVA